MTLPLEGVKVVDLSRMAPGPFCTMILGDLGADILKIEEFALSGRRAAVKGAISGAHWLNRSEEENAFDPMGRNKRSIGLNLKNDDARQVLYKLVKDADVFVEEYRPGVVKRLGVDYDTISDINPGIVYLSVTGYGQTGPYKSMVGHDINYTSTAGAQGTIGNSEGGHAIPWNLLADFAGGGLTAAVAVLAALVDRRATGRGRYVDVAMTDGVMYLMATMFEDYFKTGNVPVLGKSPLAGGNPRYAIYRTKDDKFISIASLEPWFYVALCKAMGLEDIADQYEHGMNDERVKAEIAKAFLTRTRDEWFDILSEIDSAVGRVYAIDEVATDPQVQARDMVVEMQHPTLGAVKQVGVPFKYAGESLQPRSFSPEIGENTEDVLKTIGYSPSEITALRETGAVG